MKLSEADKAVISSTWIKTAGQFDIIGKESLERLFMSFPLTKLYFPHLDMRAGSRDIHDLGKMFMKMIDNCVQHLDTIDRSLFSVGDRFFQQLLDNSAEYKLLSNALQITLHHRLPKDFGEDELSVWDKFLIALPKCR